LRERPTDICLRFGANNNQVLQGSQAANFFRQFPKTEITRKVQDDKGSHKLKEFTRVERLGHLGQQDISSILLLINEILLKTDQLMSSGIRLSFTPDVTHCFSSSFPEVDPIQRAISRNTSCIFTAEPRDYPSSYECNFHPQVSSCRLYLPLDPMKETKTKLIALVNEQEKEEHQ
ncbi:hypothetical protein HID58_069824, partial [Brassica napus]